MDFVGSIRFSGRVVVAALLAFLLSGLGVGAQAQGTQARIVDHTTTNLSAIPAEWVTAAKGTLHIAYGHTSHGSQIITGMSGLQQWLGDTYAWSSEPAAGVLHLVDTPFAADDLGSPDRERWAQATRDYLDEHPEINVVMWSWCGQVGWATAADITTYLTLMSQLEVDYPNVKFVYMTGHLDGSGTSGNLHQRNEQIRQYCRTNHKILYDFADIESYDPDGLVNYRALLATDNCDYDSDGDGQTDQNWATNWQDAHTLNVDWFDCEPAHSQALNGNLKAYAAWWLWARLAGWDGSSQAALSVGDTSATEGQDTATATFPVTLSDASAETVDVQYAAAGGGTATPGVDYVAASGTLTFAPGETEKTITITIIGDTIDEPDETFSVVLSNATNATIAKAVGIGTILDDDTSTITLTVADVSVTEGNSGTKNASFTAQLSAAATQDVILDYATTNGTATAGSDYTAATGSLTIPAGASQGTITVVVFGDTTVEADETFTLTLSNCYGAVISDGTAIGTIVNDDTAPLPVLSIAGVTVAENAGSAGFAVTLSAAASGSVTVSYATSNGTATAGSDYTTTSGILTFTAGQTSKTITVPILNDAIVEPTEAFTVTLSSPSGATIGTATATGTITNDDSTVLSIAGVTVTEGNSGTTNANFAVSLSAASSSAVTVAYATANGTATAGSDYTAKSGTLTFAAGTTSQTITVLVTGDTTVEPNEAFTVTLSGASGATIGTATATGTITNDDSSGATIPVVWTSASGVTVSGNNLTKTATVGWGNAGAVSTQTLASGDGFVQLTASETTTSRMIGLGKGNTDTSYTDLDYGLYLYGTKLLVYENGTARGDFGAFVTGDTLQVAVEGGVVVYKKNGAVLYTSGVAVTYPLLVDTALYSVNATLTSVVVSSNWGGSASPALSIAGVTVAEGNSGTTNANFAVTLSPAASGTVTVSYATVDGTATAGSGDYTAKSGTLTFAAGTTSQTITVLVTGDTTVESTETFTVTLSGASGATIGTASATGTITNDDSSGTTIPVVWTSASGVTVSGNSLTKTASTNWGNAGAVSTQTLASGDGFVQLTASETTTSRMIGLGKGNTDTSYTDLDYGLYLYGTKLLVYENGTARGDFGAFVTGDTLQVAVEGGVVVYKKNGAVLYTSGVAVTYPLLVDTALYSVNATLTSVVVSSNWGGSASPALSIAGVTVAEGNSGTTNANFAVTLSPAASGTVTVSYATVDGTATAGSGDYTAKSGTLTFAAGTTSQTITVLVTGDTTVESTEAFTVTLSGASGATIGTASATGTITNDDGATLPALSIAGATVAEGNSGTTNANFAVTLSPAASGTVTVSYATVDGTATAGSGDYTAKSGTLTFAAGTTSQTITVLVTGDTTVESTETFTVTLSGASGATIGTASATGTITNDDSSGTTIPVVWTSASGVTVSGNSLTKTASTNWGNAGAVSTQTLASGDGFVQLTASETTTSRMIGLGKGNTDTSYTDLDYGLYLYGTKLLVYENGTARGDFGAFVTGDTLQVAVEGGVVVYKKNGAVLYTSGVAVTYPLLVDTALYSVNATLTSVVVSSNWGGSASPALSIAGVTVAEGNSGTTNANFAVTLSPAASGTVTVSYATVDGTATAGSGDYTAKSGTLTFAAGTTSQTITVLVTGDTTVESTEAFTVTLSGPSGATIGTATATGTITNDDSSGTTIPVVWTAASGVTVSGNSLTKTASTNWGNAGAVSTQTLASGDGFVQLTASETTTKRMIGLGKGNTDTSYTDLDYGLYLDGTGLSVYENGTARGSFGTFATGDTLQVAVEGGVVVYKKNGTVLYTSGVAVTYPLLVDTALYTVNATLTSVVVSSNW